MNEVLLPVEVNLEKSFFNNVIKIVHHEERKIIQLQVEVIVLVLEPQVLVLVLVMQDLLHVLLLDPIHVLVQTPGLIRV